MNALELWVYAWLLNPSGKPSHPSRAVHRAGVLALLTALAIALTGVSAHAQVRRPPVRLTNGATLTVCAALPPTAAPVPNIPGSACFGTDGTSYVWDGAAWQGAGGGGGGFDPTQPIDFSGSPNTHSGLEVFSGGTSVPLTAPTTRGGSVRTDIGGMVPAGTYYFVVVADDGAGRVSAASAESMVTVSSGQAMTGASIEADWTGVPGEVFFRVYYGTVSGMEDRYFRFRVQDGYAGPSPGGGNDFAGNIIDLDSNAYDSFSGKSWIDGPTSESLPAPTATYTTVLGQPYLNGWWLPGPITIGSKDPLLLGDGYGYGFGYYPSLVLTSEDANNGDFVLHQAGAHGQAIEFMNSGGSLAHPTATNPQTSYGIGQISWIAFDGTTWGDEGGGTPSVMMTASLDQPASTGNLPGNIEWDIASPNSGGLVAALRMSSSTATFRVPVTVNRSDTEYFLWADDPAQADFGLLRVRNKDDQASPAGYRPGGPCVKYTPDSDCFERWIYKWDVTDPSNPVIQLGSEWGDPKTVTSITRSGSTATLTVTANYRTGDTVTFAGADQAEYNGDHLLTKVNATTYTFPVMGTPDSPATGTITATGGKLENLQLSPAVIQVGFSDSVYGQSAGITQVLYGGTKAAPSNILPNIVTGGLFNTAQVAGSIHDLLGFEFFSAGGGIGDTTIGGDLELYVVSQASGAYHYWNWYSTDNASGARPAFNVYDAADASQVELGMNPTGDGWVTGETFQAHGYKSSDGTAGVNGATCSLWKDGLCVQN